MKTFGLTVTTLTFIVFAFRLHNEISSVRQVNGAAALHSRLRLDYSWAKMPWTGNDAPYQTMRNNIKVAIAKGQAPAALLRQYKDAAQSEPNNPVSQFAWADAAWEFANSHVSDNEGTAALYAVPEALASVPYPRCYDFARLRFLVEFANPSLVDLGERLLLSDPNDDQVKYKLVKIYGVMLTNKAVPDVVAKKQALKCADALVREHPEKASNYASLGSVYLALWERDHDKLDGSQAIANYQKYLDMASPSAEFRPSAERLVRLVQKGQ